MNLQCRQIHITEICNIERAVTGKTYKAGSCCIKLSAVDDYVGQLQKPGAIDPRYAVLEPKEEINADYMYIAICRSFPEFLRKYRTTINLQFNTLKRFEIRWHDDREIQKYIVNALKTVEKEINLVEDQIEHEKEVKRWYLKKMMM